MSERERERKEGKERDTERGREIQRARETHPFPVCRYIYQQELRGGAAIQECVQEKKRIEREGESEEERWNV